MTRAASRRSLQPPRPAQSTSSTTQLLRGAAGSVFHSTLGTMPNYVPPRIPSRTATALLPHTLTATMSTGYAHPSLGVMPNVTVPVPVPNVMMTGAGQGLLTTASGPHAPTHTSIRPSSSSALPPPVMSLGTGSGSSSVQTVIHGGSPTAPTLHALQAAQSARQSSTASTMVPGREGWYAQSSPTRFAAQTTAVLQPTTTKQQNPGPSIATNVPAQRQSGPSLSQLAAMSQAQSPSMSSPNTVTGSPNIDSQQQQNRRLHDARQRARQSQYQTPPASPIHTQTQTLSQAQTLNSTQ